MSVKIELTESEAEAVLYILERELPKAETQLEQIRRDRKRKAASKDLVEKFKQWTKDIDSVRIRLKLVLKG